MEQWIVAYCNDGHTWKPYDSVLSDKGQMSLAKARCAERYSNARVEVITQHEMMRRTPLPKV